MLDGGLDGNVGSSRKSGEEDLKRTKERRRSVDRETRERTREKGDRTNLKLSNIGSEPAVQDSVLICESESDVGGKGLEASHCLDVGSEIRSRGGGEVLRKDERKTGQSKES